MNCIGNNKQTQFASNGMRLPLIKTKQLIRTSCRKKGLCAVAFTGPEREILPLSGTLTFTPLLIQRDVLLQ